MKTPILYIILFQLFACKNSSNNKEFNYSNLDSNGRNIIIAYNVMVIAESNRVDAETIGYGSDLSPIYTRYLRLKRVCRPQDLQRLTEHPNAAVRTYAFMALCEMNDSSRFPIYMKHLSDTQQVQVLGGCIGTYHPVNELFKLHLFDSKLKD